MGISISEAARRWGVGRETIYRKQRAGELSFATTEPPTIDGSEMLRVFGEPKPKRDKGAGGDVALARVEVERDHLKAEADRLRAELATAKQEFYVDRDDARKERDRLLDMLASQQRLLESQARRPSMIERLFGRRPGGADAGK